MALISVPHGLGLFLDHCIMSQTFLAVAGTPFLLLVRVSYIWSWGDLGRTGIVGNRSILKQRLQRLLLQDMCWMEMSYKVVGTEQFVSQVSHLIVLLYWTVLCQGHVARCNLKLST